MFAPEPSGDHVYGNDDEDDGGGATSWWVYRKVHDHASASELSRSRRFGTSVLGGCSCKETTPRAWSDGQRGLSSPRS
jgi:hypothetical protein